MPYDDPISLTYDLGGNAAVQFGADGEAKSYEFIGPKDKRGVVRDIEIEVTEAMVGTTTVPEIGVGDAASDLASLDNEYGRFRLGSTEILGYGTDVSPNPIRASSLVNSRNEIGASSNPGKQSLRYSEHVALEKAFIPANTPFFISLVPGSGGSETGAGRVRVYIDWF